MFSSVPAAVLGGLAAAVSFACRHAIANSVRSSSEPSALAPPATWAGLDLGGLSQPNSIDSAYMLTKLLLKSSELLTVLKFSNFAPSADFGIAWLLSEHHNTSAWIFISGSHQASSNFGNLSTFLAIHCISECHFPKPTDNFLHPFDVQLPICFALNLGQRQTLPSHYDGRWKQPKAHCSDTTLCSNWAEMSSAKQHRDPFAGFQSIYSYSLVHSSNRCSIATTTHLDQRGSLCFNFGSLDRFYHCPRGDSQGPASLCTLPGYNGHQLVGRDHRLPLFPKIRWDGHKIRSSVRVCGTQHIPSWSWHQSSSSVCWRAGNLQLPFVSYEAWVGESDSVMH